MEHPKWSRIDDPTANQLRSHSIRSAVRLPVGDQSNRSRAATADKENRRQQQQEPILFYISIFQALSNLV